jgi:hypothetical protein
LLAKHENVFADISWLPHLAGLDRRILAHGWPPVSTPYFHWTRPLLYYFSQTFGLGNKLLWGTDFPSVTPRGGIGALEALTGPHHEDGLPGLSADVIRRLLHENWRLVFKRISS